MSEELIAYLADRRAGRLIRKDNGNLQFRYDDGYDGPRLAMRIDGAVHIEDVSMEAWLRLAREIGVSERFAERTTTAIRERTLAGLVTAWPRDPPAIVHAIVQRVDALA